MNYIIHILIMINIYLILSLSLNLLVGYTGLLSITHAAFYGIGAYITTLLMIKTGLNFFIALLIAIPGVMFFSLIVAFLSLRLKGDYFILATVAFQVIVFTILHNWVGLTRGPYGIRGIPRPVLLGFEFDSLPSYFLLSFFFALVILILSSLLYNSPFGRVLKAIREDEIATKAMGKNIVSFKIWAFLIGCGVASISGALYAGYVTYIDPTSFTLMESIFILSIVLVGGSGNLRGPIIGAIFMVILPEILRFLGLPDTIAPNVRQMVYGALLIILMRYRPQGLAGEYAFE